MTKGRIVLVLLLVCGLAALSSHSAQQKNAPRAGWISDESCGAQHTKPGRADCVQKCWRGGASAGPPQRKPQRGRFFAHHCRTLLSADNPPTLPVFPPLLVGWGRQPHLAKKTVH